MFLNEIEYRGLSSDSAGELALGILETLIKSSEEGIDIPKEDEDKMFQFAELLRFRLGTKAAREGLERILMGDYATYTMSRYKVLLAELVYEIRDMFDCKQQVKYHPYDVWEHTLATLANAPHDRIIRLVLFFHDIGKPESMTVDEDGTPHFYGHEEVSEKICRCIMTRLRFDEAEVELVSKMVGFHKLRPDPTVKSVKKLLKTIGEDNFNIFYYVRLNDNAGQSMTYFHERKRKIDIIRKIAKKLIKEANSFKIADLGISGTDLISD